MEYPPAHPVRAARSRPVDAFDAAGWSDQREVRGAGFTHKPAKDQTLVQILSSLPDWVVITAGGLAAAILGAMVGGALHI